MQVLKTRTTWFALVLMALFASASTVSAQDTDDGPFSDHDKLEVEVTNQTDMALTVALDSETEPTEVLGTVPANETKWFEYEVVKERTWHSLRAYADDMVAARSGGFPVYGEVETIRWKLPMNRVIVDETVIDCHHHNPGCEFPSDDSGEGGR